MYIICDIMMYIINLEGNMLSSIKTKLTKLLFLVLLAGFSVLLCSCMFIMKPGDDPKDDPKDKPKQDYQVLAKG